MGEVFRGHDDRLDRPVALKRIVPDARKPEKALRRFRREARAVARLSHPSIVGIYDWEECEGQHWLVMELVEGRRLDEIIAEGPLPPERAMAIAREVASGLAAAHEAGLVHRDLKPANVIVRAAADGTEGSRPGRSRPGRSRPGLIKILDFGLAKAVEGQGVPLSTLTKEGQLVGTVSAMSPEQAQGRVVDHRSDLFSLGSLLYEMLSGSSPFEGASKVETLTRICTAKEEPLDRLGLEIPGGLARLVGRLLEKEPARRPADARQVVAKLDALVASPGVAPDTAISPTRSSHTSTLSEESSGISRSVIQTLLMSDLVDSAGLVERLGDERAAAVFEQHDRLARRLMAEHEGLEVDKSDTLLILFARPLAAVRYALAYHAAVARLAEREGLELATRVGIHVGEVVLHENEAADVARGARPLEVAGFAKVVVARFVGLARGGQTLVSRGVYDMARRASVGAEPLAEGLCWIEHGRYRLKGSQESVGVFEVGVEGEAPLVAPANSEETVRVEMETAEHRVTSRRWRWAAAALMAGVGLWALAAWVGSRNGEVPAVDASATAAETEAGPSSYELYQRGMHYLERPDREGNIDKGITEFQEALARDERFAPALAGLAWAYLLDAHRGSRDPQRLEQALAAAEQAVQTNEHLAVARVSLGRVYSQMGRFEDAERELEKALEIEPSNSDAWFGLGKVSRARGDLQQAEKHYQRAIAAQPDNWFYHSALGGLYYQAGRYDEAVVAYLRQLELVPDNFGALRNLGAIYYMKGRLPEAATQLQRALQIRPDSTVYANVGTIYFTQGLYAQSVSAFDQAIKNGGSNNYLLWGNLGDACRWTPHHEERAREAYLRAIQLVQKRLEARPRDATLQTRLELYLAKRGDCDRALAESEESGNLPGDDGSAWFRRAVAYEICGRRDSALAALGAALQGQYSLEEVRRDPELLGLRQDVRYHRLEMKFQSDSST